MTSCDSEPAGVLDATIRWARTSYAIMRFKRLYKKVRRKDSLVSDQMRAMVRHRWPTAASRVFKTA